MIRSLKAAATTMIHDYDTSSMHGVFKANNKGRGLLLNPDFAVGIVARRRKPWRNA